MLMEMKSGIKHMEPQAGINGFLYNKPAMKVIFLQVMLLVLVQEVLIFG